MYCISVYIYICIHAFISISYVEPRQPTLTVPRHIHVSILQYNAAMHCGRKGGQSAREGEVRGWTDGERAIHVEAGRTGGQMQLVPSGRPAGGGDSSRPPTSGGWARSGGRRPPPRARRRRGPRTPLLSIMYV